MNSKRKTWVIALMLIALVFGYGTYRYMYQPHRNIATEAADYLLSPEALKAAMSSANEEQKFINKVIQTQGRITSVDQYSIVLDDMIQISFESDLPSYLNPETALKIKGRCIGRSEI